MTRHPETRLIRGRAVRVEQRAIPSRRKPLQPARHAPPLPIGPTAIDCGHLLRHGPLRFPDVLVPAAWVGVR